MTTPDFEIIYRELYPRVVYFFEGRGFRREDAEDLAQETFLRVQPGLARLRNHQAATGWVFTIATNVWRNHLRYRHAVRRTGREVTIDSAPESATSVDPERTPQLSHEAEQERAAQAVETTRALAKAVLRLPPRMRQTFLLRFDQDRNYQEIALLMGVTVQAVKSQIHQARTRLQEILEEESDEQRP